MLVLSKCQLSCTASVGLLSYSFLRWGGGGWVPGRLRGGCVHAGVCDCACVWWGGARVSKSPNPPQALTQNPPHPEPPSLSLHSLLMYLSQPTKQAYPNRQNKPTPLLSPRATKSQDVVVPIVDYDTRQEPWMPLQPTLAEANAGSCSNWGASLAALLQWGPYATEQQLLERLQAMGPHGTQVGGCLHVWGGGARCVSGWVWGRGGTMHVSGWL